MTKEAKIGFAVGAVVIVGVLAYIITQMKSEQASTQAQLDAMRAQVAAASQPGAPVSAPPASGGVVSPGLVTAPVDNSVLTKQKATMEYLNTAAHLMAAGDLASARQAAQIYQEAIDNVDAQNVQFYIGLGRAYLASGQNEDAVRAFTQGRTIDPRRAELFSGTGWGYWNLKHYYEAKEAWEDALKFDPNSQETWKALAWVYMATGDQEKSKQGFVILLKLDPDRNDWKLGLTMARAGNKDIDQIRAQFKGMPDPAAFLPPASRPAGS